MKKISKDIIPNHHSRFQLHLDLDSDAKETPWSASSSLHRSFARGLALDVPSDSNDESKTGQLLTSLSFVLSSSSTFDMKGLQVKSSGIHRPCPLNISSPLKKKGRNDNDVPHWIKLNALGKGASGIVYKGLHANTVRIVAIKEIPIFDASKRHQLQRELLSLYGNLQPIHESTANLTPAACPHSS